MSNFKSFIAGIIVGGMCMTAFAGGIISSAEYKSYDINLNGENVISNAELVSVLEKNSNNMKLYMPVRDVLEELGYTVEWDKNNSTVNIVNSSNYYGKNNYDTKDSASNQVINLKNRNTFNMSESGNFYAKDNQVLKLQIDANLINGSVDFVLFNPDGDEQESINITKINDTKIIELSKGRWAYNCSGMFRGGGECRIIGIIE